MAQPVRLCEARLAGFLLHRLGNVANLQHNTHAHSLMPEDVAMHEPYTGIIQRESQNDVAVGLDVYSVFEKGRLSVEVFGFFCGRARLIRIVRAAQIKLAGADNVKSISVLLMGISLGKLVRRSSIVDFLPGEMDGPCRRHC